MDIFLTFLMLIVVGAIIGGATNSLAIRMLFRPLRPVYIGKWRLPFTPGLIPKRRDDMAVQLGKVVVEHLLTAEGITKKFNEKQFQGEITSLVKSEASRFLNREDSLLELAGSFGVERLDTNIEQVIQEKIEEKYWSLIRQAKENSIGQLLPHQLENYIEAKIPQLAEKICTSAIEFFESRQGKEKLSHLINHFLADKGTLGNIINMFLGNESLLNKVQPEIIKFFKQPTTKKLFQELIVREWTSVKEKKLADFDNELNYQAFLDWLKAQVLNQLKVRELLNKPLRELVSVYRDRILEQIIPSLLSKLGGYATTKIDRFMSKLPLAEVVKEQVESFPVERLETIVLTISSKEFKMITYLGALLGGMIGAVQGILLLFL